MPEEVSSELVEKIMQLRKGGAKWPEIAKATGLAYSTVTRHFYKHATTKQREQSASAVHKLIPAEINKVINMTREGMGAQTISKKLGISMYNVYHARQLANVPYSGPHPGGDRRGTDKQRETRKFDKKVFKLKQRGLTLAEVSTKLHQPKGTVSSAYYRYVNNHENNKGETNGNLGIVPVRDKGTITTRNSATIDVLAGILFAETVRRITHLCKGAAQSADKLGRRLSELLADSPVRQERGSHQD